MTFTLTIPSRRAEQVHEEAGVRYPRRAGTVENAEALRFLDTLAQGQQLEDGTGDVDKAAELAVRALVSAAILWRYHGQTVAAGARAILADQVSIYVNTAWSWRNQSVAVVSPTEAAARAEILEAAAEKVAQMLRALETQYAL
ncbi:hypothetical protein ACWELJ_25835 [Nocardia sp. NPDC004582]